MVTGNLPYSATKESIAEHFVKLHPTEIRLRTYKGTEKFMGTCFVEFDRFDRMETCLKKYHHSVFPDGKTKEGRKINVELRCVLMLQFFLQSNHTNIYPALAAAATAKAGSPRS
jgi:RNA recognition motif-containing protein